MTKKCCYYDCNKKLANIKFNCIRTKVPIQANASSRTVEALDRSNLDVLTKIEKQVNQCGILENINPNLKLFLTGKKAVEAVESGSPLDYT